MRTNFYLHFFNRCIVILTCLFSSMIFAAEFPGGFIEQPGINSPRALLSESEIKNILPARGKFTFPAPYNTDAVRLTNGSDCGNADCLAYTGYSYWSNINNHVGSDTMLIFMGMNRNKGGAGPSLIEYNKVTESVQNLGPIFNASEPLSWATGEGWYFSATMPNAFYLNSGPSLKRYDVSTGLFTQIFDVENLMGKGLYVWQAHSSADDRVHSVTVRDLGNYEMLGCLVYFESNKRYNFYPKIGDYDECQIDKSGNWLLIKENIDGRDGEDNRIINLQTGLERILLDSEGAAGHSDLGYGYMIASDNFAVKANTQKLWKFDSNPLTGTVVYSNSDWNVAAPSHVSHQNANPNIAPENQLACGSSANRTNSVEANEIICFGLDGKNQALVVAPVMTNLDASGGGDNYAKAPKGNLDVTGQYFVWTSNMGGNRLDAFIVKVPGHLLSGTNAVSALPVQQPAPTPVVEEPAPTPVVQAPAPTPVVQEPAPTPVVQEPAPTPVVQAPAPTPVVQKPAPTNLVGPVQTAIKVVNITSQSALITWQTNVVAEDAAQYGLTSSYSRGTPINSALVTSHSALLENLVPDSLYHYRVATRDVNSNVTISQDFTFTTMQANATTEVKLEQLIWTNLFNVTSSGNILSKTSGCDGCGDASANSQQIMKNGYGYLEFTVNETQNMRIIGLSEALSGTGANDINFAFRLQGGYAEVRENGEYRTDITVSPGDVLCVEALSGKVNYSRNGKVFYTSSTIPAYPMKVYASLFSGSSSISNAKISTETTSLNLLTNANDTLVPVSGRHAPLIWNDLVNATAIGNILTKTSGCEGCEDSGASSVQVLRNGDGYLEFTVNETQDMRYIGLAKDSSGIGANDMEFAFRLQGGYAEVREYGVYRTDTKLNAGDVLRIAIENGVVGYARNGVVFYTSTELPAYPIKVYARLYSSGSTVSNAIGGQ